MSAGANLAYPIRSWKSLILLTLTAPAWPESLSVQQAVTNALAHHASIQATAAAKKAAGARVSEMRGALAPRITYNESWQLSNNQVFVFGTLLTQKQFTGSNFDLGLLNNPPYLNNFQSQVILDQTIYDSGLRRSRIQAAELGRDLPGEDSRRTEMGVIAAVLRAYYTASLAEETARVAREAVRSAEADLRRAETRRSAGVTTDADVLSVRVHLAAMRERQIRSGSDLEIALAALNDAMGIPLDSRFDLSTSLEALEMPSPGGEIDREALENRAELREARLMVKITEANARSVAESLRQTGSNSSIEGEPTGWPAPDCGGTCSTVSPTRLAPKKRSMRLAGAARRSDRSNPPYAYKPSEPCSTCSLPAAVSKFRAHRWRWREKACASPGIGMRVA